MRLWQSGLFAFIVLFFVFSHPVIADEIKTDENVNFISLADIHFDPYIGCPVKTTCPLIQALRQAPVNEWAGIFTQYETKPSQYREDTNYLLLRQALDAAKKEADQSHAKFAIVLGDFLGHEYRRDYIAATKDRSRSGYRAFVKKTMQFLMNELDSTFPTISIYSIIGNNDSYQGDYFSEINGPFFQDAASQFAGIVRDKEGRDSLLKTFSSAGYYAVTVPATPQLRLIVLNSVLFSPKAGGKNVERAADEQMIWLHNELAEVKANHQKAFILIHIPTGIDVYATLKIRLFTLLELWQHKYIERFHRELTQYGPQVAGVFAGHLHSDWFQVQAFGATEIPITGTPSISPIFGNNPGFKIYSYSSGTINLGNFLTIYHPISVKQAYGIQYDTHRIHHASCRDCAELQNASRVLASGGLWQKLKSWYVPSSSLQSQNQWNPSYWCALQDTKSNTFSQCRS